MAYYNTVGEALTGNFYRVEIDTISDSSGIEACFYSLTGSYFTKILTGDYLAHWVRKGNRQVGSFAQGYRNIQLVGGRIRISIYRTGKTFDGVHTNISIKVTKVHANPRGSTSNTAWQTRRGKIDSTVIV